MKTIRITVNNESDLPKLFQTKKAEIINKVLKMVQSQDFISYMASKIKKALDEIAESEVSTINNEALDGTGAEKQKYLNSMNFEIKDNTIMFFNNSVINLSEKRLKPSTRIRYPLQLSLSSIIEYGIGYTGGQRAQNDVDNWEYDVRGHGSKGWYYLDSAGNVHWTNGLAGRYVFLKLKWWVEENARDIIIDYINKNL